MPEAAGIAFLVAALLLIWVGTDPFHDLRSVSNIEASESGSLATQIAFSLLAIPLVLLLGRIGPGRMRALATPALVATAGWVLVTVPFSVAPAVSLRRMALLAITVATAAAILHAARTVRLFATTLAGAALAILLVSFISLALVPDLATHTAADLREPEHAGAWRGLFSHKNEAGAVMAVFVFVGLLASGAGRPALGVALALGSGLFLAGTGSKTALALLPLILAQTGLCRLVRGEAARLVILLGPLALMLGATLGSLYLPPVRDAVTTALGDASFTGRADLWEFTIEHSLRKPIAGWGYGAFWKTEATLYGGSEQLTWVTGADQAHQGYLDTALFMGLPGLALTAWAFVLGPSRDLARAMGAARPEPLALFFGRVWLLGISTAAFESVFYDGKNSIFFMFLVGVFGLRFLAAGTSVRS